MSEIQRLIDYLEDNNYNYEWGPLSGGDIVKVYDDNGDYLWDAICHNFSYGHEEGLLEIMGTIVQNPLDEVEGWLTADEIIFRLGG